MSAEKPLPSHEAAGGTFASSAGLPPTESQGGEKAMAAVGTTPLERAADMAEELYHLRDTFFPRDPAEKTAALRARADSALALLDAFPPDQRKAPQQRGIYEFLRGKILDVFPDYHKEAEDHLSKAVKLNPSLVDAWLCLGNCIWKKGDLGAAKNCFSLALSKGSDKKILSQLSMLERSMAQGSADQALLVEESIKHAKEAVMLDITDGNSWYNLGNAYLTSFFVGGAWDHTKLHLSVKAYQNAERDKSMNSNPDLYYNFATAHKYLENYERALHGFEAAALRDPGLDADTEIQKIISLLDKLENAMKGQLRSKRLASLVSSLSNVKLKTSHKKGTFRLPPLRSLQLSRPSRFMCLSGACFSNVHAMPLADPPSLLTRPLQEYPFRIRSLRYYLTCDMDQSYFILSVYGLRNDAIKEGDRVVLFEPHYRILDMSWKDKRYQFKSIRVDFPEQILINEKEPAHQYVVRASIHTQNKP